MLAYQGYTTSINGIGAPFIARSFGLGDAGIATLYAWISPAALGVLLLSRLADRVGRRRVLLACMAATPIAAFGAGASQNVVLFAIWDVLLYAFAGATISSAVVMMSEVVPMRSRARGQGYAGLATAAGSGLCLILMPCLDAHGLSWRWLLMISGAGLLGVPLLVVAMPESDLWQQASERGSTRSGRFFDVFRAPHSFRARPVVVCAFLTAMASASADAWAYYHAVSGVGLTAGAASALVLVGGGLGMVGFPLGAWACERVGRVPTVVVSWLFAAGGILGFFWGPPEGSAFPVYWLGAAYFGWKTVDNAALVGFRAASTELFPTALRSTLIGWTSLIGAVGIVAAQSTIAVLAGPLGGLSRVVGYLGLLAIPAALVFGWFIDETRGLPLPVASNGAKE